MQWLQHRTCLSILILTLIAPGVAGAQGTRDTAITLLGPGLNGHVAVTNVARMRFLQTAEVANFLRPIASPGGLGAGYELAWYAGHVLDQRMCYYPAPTGGRGYIFYVGPLKGRSPYAGRWFRAGMDEPLLRRILIEYGARLGHRGERLLPSA